jgi:uncharacterized membrane protein
MTSKQPSDANPNEVPPSKEHHGKPISKFRNYMLAGMLVVAPFAITFYLAWLFIDFVDTRVKPLIPLNYNPDTYLPFGVPGIGLVIVILFLALVGWVTAGFLGRFTVRSGERIMARMPVIRSIYGAAKQIVETVLSQQSTAFREVVMFEYPRPGIWAIGFITGEPGRIIQDHVEDEVVNILLPTTPNPTSGFLLFVPRKSIQVLDMSIEEGMKMVISVGIVSPDDKRIKAAKPTPKFSTARPPIYARAEKPDS